MRLFLLIIVLTVSQFTWADDFRPASLTLQPLANDRYEVLWNLPIKNRQLPQFNVVFDQATIEYLPKRSRTVGGSYLQSWEISRANGIGGMEITIEGLNGSSYEVILRIPVNGKGTTITTVLNTEAPFYKVPVSQSFSPSSVFSNYLELGFKHILAGFDHLLFVFALVLLVVGWRKLLWTITFFTIAHSFTLAAVTLNLIHLPGPPVEAVIALSIVFLAKEIISVHRGKLSFARQYPWIVAFIFGLLHGMGFAGALNEIGVPENEVFIALLSFNIGVELGQIAFVAAILLLIMLSKRLLAMLPVWMHQIPAYAIGSVASIWLLQRLMVF